MSKRIRILVFIGVFTLLISIGGSLTYFRLKPISGPLQLLSPLPKIFENNQQSVLASTHYWQPLIPAVGGVSYDLEITAQSALAYDLTSDRLLYSKNITRKMPMASLTKIMTALVAIENEKIDRKIRISGSAATVGENAMGLEEGEIHTLNDLLYGLILPSGNDAAEAIAEGSSFGRDNFIYLMNKKAQDLGLNDTNFTNPSGLEGDGDQHTTALDLLVITRYALQNPSFAELVATFEHEILPSNDHKAYHLYNDTNLLTTYPGVRGVKTGFTNEAGMCLVTYLEYEGRKIIAVLLNSSNRREEMKQLLDYSLQQLDIKPPSHP